MYARTLNGANVMTTAAAELKAVLEELDIVADFVVTPDGAGDLILPGPLVVEVKEAPRPTMAQLRRWGLGAAQEDARERIVVLVADWVDPSVREELMQASWGWLERAGHLRLVGGGFHIDRDVESLLGPDPLPPDPLRRESGLSVAIELMARMTGPDRWARQVTIREVAGAADISVGSAHKAMTQLTDLGLLDQSGIPRSSLFWSVAREWRVRWFPVKRPPDPMTSDTLQRLLRFRLDALDEPGWAEAGDGAAGRLGAPIGAEGPQRFFVPDRRALTWALRTFGEAVEERSASAFVAAPPTVAAARRREPERPWPLARRIVIAVELASSGPRGREALQQWPDRPTWIFDE